jgi:hypothetical protein
MRTTRLIAAPLAAALTAAALAGPAAALPADAHNQSNGWYAGKSTTHGSLRSQGARSDTTTLPGPPTWPANPQPITRSGAVVHAQSKAWTPTATQIRSALAQERYYMSFGQH